MKKFVAGLIILCLIIVAGVGYLGSRNGGVPQGAPVANSTAGHAGCSSRCFGMMRSILRSAYVPLYQTGTVE